MIIWTIWGTNRGPFEVHLDDRKWYSHYNWLFSTSSGVETVYNALSKDESTVTLTVL